MTKRAYFLVHLVALGAPVWCNAGAAFAQPNATSTTAPVAPHSEPTESSDLGLQFGAFVQAGGRAFVSGDGTDTFMVRRARIDARATYGKYFGVRVHPELAGGSVTLLDAYGTLTFMEEVALFAGKMKSPLGLELLQKPHAMLFPERGLPSLLVPNRDVGVCLQGAFLRSTISYALGVFNGVPDGAHGDQDANNAKDFEGRLFVKPFVPLDSAWGNGFGLGVAASFGDESGVLPSYRTPGRETFFSFVDGAVADGPRTRFTPQAYYYYGHFGVLGEYVQSIQDAGDGTTTARLDSRAWQVWGSVVVGGQAGFLGASPTAPIDPARGDWGALEIGARYGMLELDDAAFDAGLADPSLSADAAKSVGASLSWWFRSGTRVLVSFDRTVFEGGAVNGDRETEAVVTSLLQLAL